MCVCAYRSQALAIRVFVRVCVCILRTLRVVVYGTHIYLFIFCSLFISIEYCKSLYAWVWATINYCYIFTEECVSSANILRVLCVGQYPGYSGRQTGIGILIINGVDMHTKRKGGLFLSRLHMHVRQCLACVCAFSFNWISTLIWLLVVAGRKVARE